MTLARLASTIASRAVKVGNAAEVSAADLAGLLTNCEDGDILVLDNIDRLAKDLRDSLCSAVSDFSLEIEIDNGPARRSARLTLPRFTLIATATREEKLDPFLTVAFPMVEHLQTYTITELLEIARVTAETLNLQIEDLALRLIATSGSATPKGILNRLRFVGTFARTKASSEIITETIASRALSIFSSNEAGANADSRRAISSEVRREVWRRDGGKCVKCGSRERLEYDHIIPISKGGSNTPRNIELLCEVCNRSKSALIQ